MSVQGEDTRVLIGSSSATSNEIDEINNASMKHSGNLVELSHFGDTYKTRGAGLKDVTYSLKGFWDPADTNGQVVLRSAFIAGSDLWLTILPDGSTGWKQQVLVDSFDISAAVDGYAEFSAELAGNGALGGST